MKQRVALQQIFAPISEITRNADDTVTVEGYAFVNEVVPGEGGLRILRSAMEAATPDYMKWACVREMHGPVAAGVAQEVTWDSRGCKLRALVVDSEAVRKVLTGVYKGFSIGVLPTAMAGKEVRSLVWKENSLVDRPRDPDARFVVARSEEIPEEGECEILDETTSSALESPANLSSAPLSEGIEDVTRAMTSEAAPTRENLEPQPKCSVCGRVCRYCDGSEEARRADGPAAEAEGVVPASEAAPVVETGPEPVMRAEPETPSAASVILRLNELEETVQRFDLLLSERDRALLAAQEEIRRLEALPPTDNRPILYRTLERGFFANEDRARTESTTAIQAELATLCNTRGGSAAEQLARVERIQRLRMQLAEVEL